MALLMIKLEKEDIVTSKIGENTQIITDKFNLVFSREALDELVEDYNKLKKDEEILLRKQEELEDFYKNKKKKL